jgi:hypothetical protein
MAEHRQRLRTKLNWPKPLREGFKALAAGLSEEDTAELWSLAVTLENAVDFSAPELSPFTEHEIVGMPQLVVTTVPRDDHPRAAQRRLAAKLMQTAVQIDPNTVNASTAAQVAQVVREIHYEAVRDSASSVIAQHLAGNTAKRGPIPAMGAKPLPLGVAKPQL